MKISIANMKCEGCVATVTQILATLPGCSAADVDLASGQAIVYGEVEPQQVKEVLAEAGYPATVLEA